MKLDSPHPQPTPAPDGPGTPAAGSHLLPGALARDPFVRSYLLASAVALAVFLAPLPGGPTRQTLGGWINLLFQAWPVFACFYRLRDVRDEAERRFWLVFGFGTLCWIAALVISVSVTAGQWNSSWDLTTEALYLLYYGPALFAFDSLVPSARTDDRPALRWIGSAGLFVTMVGWAIYAVLIPATADRIGGPQDWLAYVALDLVVVGAVVAARYRSQSPRWRALLGGLLVGVCLNTVYDLVNAAVQNVLVPREQAPWFSLSWILPDLVFLLAIRLRCHIPQDPPAPPSEVTPLPQRSAAHSIVPVLGAFSLPVVHMTSMALDLVPPAVAVTQGLVVAVITPLLTALAWRRYQLLEEARTRLVRERADLEQALVQTQKMEAIGRLGGGIAHDFNNLLTAIGGYSDIVLESLPESDPTAEAMRRVRAAVGQASALTHQLLTFSRRQVLRAEPVDVNEAVRDFPNTHRHLMSEQTRVQMDLSPLAGCAWVDPAQFDQVLLNLLVNSRDAMPTGGVITVRTSSIALGDGAPAGWPESQAGRYVRVEVADTGSGIPADTLPQIFEPFFTTKPSGKGTGLGLALVYGIVRQTGGRVSVSSAVGSGTAFTIDLPSAPEPSPVARADGPRDIITGSETILLVEDEPAVRELVKAMLSMGGYHVLVAASGDEALLVARRHEGHLDLLFTDVVMPGINGRVLAERLVAERPGTRVLFMTGYTDDTVVHHGVLGGSYALLPKPFTRTTLFDMVRRVLDSPPGAVAALPQPEPPAPYGGPA